MDTTYELTAQEREAAWREAERAGGPFASPPGFQEWSFAQRPAPPYRPTPKRGQAWSALPRRGERVTLPTGEILVFCNDLEAGVRKALRDSDTLWALRQAGAVYRADTLFEASADLSDRVVEQEQGLVNDTAVRFEAMKVARLAVLLWLSVVGEGDEHGC